MTKRISGGFVELGFYYDKVSEADAFAFLIEHLHRSGATFSGDAALSVGPEIRERYYSVENASITYASNITDAEANRLLWDTDTKLLSIDMLNITGLVRRKSEIVTLPILRERIPNCSKHPVSILTEGLPFDNVRSKRQKDHAQRVGACLRAKFTEIIAATNPAYASISYESTLPPPEILKGASEPDPALGNFYVRNEYVSKSALKRLIATVGQEFTLTTDSGVFFYTFQYFHPEHIGRDPWDVREAATRTLGRIND